ncbi:hypothetical protein JHK82_024939 [Glycine max]|nr:hypothetical protein JHK82_024939 [Glycine max]
MKDTIVLYPNLGTGHLVSMVELGKLILTQYPSLSITILILTPPITPSTTTIACDSNARYITTVTATTPAITFHHVPFNFNTPSLPLHILSLEFTRHSTQNITVALQTLAKASNLKALVMDFMNFNDPKALTKNLNNNAKDPSSQSYQALLQLPENMEDGVGIITNTFEGIEEKPIRTLSEDVTIPPLFCVRPMISAPYGE